MRPLLAKAWTSCTVPEPDMETLMIQLVVVLVILGVVLYLVNTYIPLAQLIKIIINVIVVLVICLWLLRLAGFTGTWFPAR